MGNRYRYYGNTNAGQDNGVLETWTTTGNKGGDLYNYNNNLFSKGTSGSILKNGLGFTQSQAEMIIPQQLYTYYSNGNGYNYAETPSTDGGTYYTIFPLAVRAAHTATKQNFCIEDYLKTTSQMHACFIGSNTLCYQWDLRSGSPSERNAHCAFVPGKNLAYTSGVNNSSGVRPAFVLRVMG